MKTLLIVNGAMGVGKTTVCAPLLERLQPAAYVDGDWCWTMRPFEATPENKALVHANIAKLLRGYLTHSLVETVIFSWVLHRDGILEQLLAPLADLRFRLVRATLMLTPEQLRARLKADIAAGRRSSDIVEKSLVRLAECATLDTVKIDASGQPTDVAEAIVRHLRTT